MFEYTLEELDKIYDFYQDNDERYWKMCNSGVDDDRVVSFIDEYDMMICNPFVYYNLLPLVDEVLKYNGVELTKNTFDTVLERIGLK